MEKQASNFKIARFRYTTLLVSLLLFTSLFTFAQDLSLGDSKRYVIGSIDVKGNTTYNKKTIVTYTGLREGQVVYLPGDDISKAIKKLWDLSLFSDVNLYLTRVEDDNVAHLELEVQQVPVLKNVRIEGVKKGKRKEFIEDNELTEGTKVTENLITTTKNYIRDKFRKNGFLNTKVLVNVKEVKDSIDTNKVNMLVRVDKGERVKIDSISVIGNEKISDASIRKYLKKTKRKNAFRFWKRSKYIADEYKADKEKVIEKYKEKGYRDARITSDTIYRGDKNIALQLNVEEGKRYYFGDINFLGNSIFSDYDLAKKLVLKKGDVYNGVLLKKRIADDTKPDGDDITNLYQNNGYFFSRIQPVETKVENDSIDFEIRIVEGKLAHFNNITVVGNNRTNDHVVFRNIRTRPGEVYSKEKLVRSLRELGQTTFFDTEQLSPNIKNVDPNAGTLDVEYSVVEKGSSQFELQGGFGGTGFIGTLGLRFNNFSIRNIFKGKSYTPLPSGDGQSLSLRAQASQSFRTYSLSFVEPWLGGKKPFSLSVSLSHTKQFRTDFSGAGRVRVDESQSFLLTGGSVGIAKRLKWPDDYFTVSHTLTARHYDLQNFSSSLFTFPNGDANDLTYTFGLTRDNTNISPIFPIGGSRFSMTFKTSLPYSSFDSTDWAALREERNEIIANGQDPNNRISQIDQKRFKFLEYYKIKFSGDWYTQLPKKFVFKSSFSMGFLGAYNQDRGLIPFERFRLGGSGLGGNVGLASIENVALRGYPDASITSLARDITGPAVNSTEGSTIFNKYSLELRYPISLKPAATIYGLGFVEGGAAYNNFKQFNPFQLNRSAGVGIRIFMPAFGLLGIDFGHGFDPVPGGTEKNGWETHFILGQQF